MTKRRLIIVGAGGFGREVLQWAEDSIKSDKKYEVKGFIDDNLNSLKNYQIKYKVIDKINDYSIQMDEDYICAIGNPIDKLRICTELKNRGANFITIIHPKAYIGGRCKIGSGCILSYGVIITSDVTIGNFVSVNVYSTIGHDAKIDDGSTISAHCDITGFVHLKTGVFMGSNSSVTPGITIGEYSTIGAGSIVYRNVNNKTTVIGNPAIKIFNKNE